jgi:hypothetical protein
MADISGIILLLYHAFNWPIYNEKIVEDMITDNIEFYQFNQQIKKLF